MKHSELRQKILKIEFQLGETYKEINKIEETENIDVRLALRNISEAITKTGAAYYCLVDEIEKKAR